jgi:hypothetical protein
LKSSGVGILCGLCVLGGKTRLVFTALLLAAVQVFSACSTLPLGGGTEPREIVVRNRSNEDIATVTLREKSWSSDGAAKYGSLSPVPKGVSQSYVRPSNPPRFPREVTVEWVDAEGRTLRRDVSLGKALRDATGAPGEALVFEIGPLEDVRVIIEQDARQGDRK